MVTVFDNFTISIVSIPEAAGDNVIVDNPEAILLITPDLGYSVLAQDFNFTAPLPNHVASVNFVQVGTNVECIVTFTSPFIMPASNVEIGLCLKGLARLITYNVTGQINVTKTNATSSPSNLSFNISGNFNQTLVARTITLTANSGFSFLVAPTLTQTAGDTSIFNITSTNVLDINGNLLSKTFTINCTIPNYNSFGNIFQATAFANVIYVPVVGVTNYTVDDSLIAAGGDVRALTLLGTPGAAWTLTCAVPIIGDVVDPGGEDEENVVVTTLSGVIGPNGTSDVTLVFPVQTVDTTYSLLLSGDLVTPFPSPNPIVFSQLMDITVTYTTSPTAYFVNDGDKYNSGAPGIFTSSGMDGYYNDFNWNISTTNNYGILLVGTPNPNEFSNTNQATNGGTNFIPFVITATQTLSTSVNLNFIGGIIQYGTSSFTSVLDLSEFIAYVDTADPSNVAATTATSGGSVVFTGSGGVMGLRGLCYSTNPLPTVADSTVPGGTGFSAFTSSLTGLTGSTLYYTRAYAYDSTNTIVTYGPEKTFTTLPELEALPTTFVTNEDTNFTIQLLSVSIGPSPDFIITSLPNTLQGDIYDPGTNLKITTVPYTLVNSGSTVLFDPALNYFGSITPFNFKLYQNPTDSNVATVSGTVLAINDAPIFDQPAPLYGGDPGGTYTYVGTVSDPDTPAAQLVVSVASNSSLPPSWTLVQTPGTNQFTLTGPVPAGADYSIILQVSDGALVNQQLVTVNAVFATLSNMEFKLNYIGDTVTAGGTGRSPKSTGLIPLSIKPAGTGGHGCNRAQFNLVAGVFANVGGTGTWQWTNLGKGSLNNVTGTGPFNVFESSVPSLALLPFTTTQIPIADVDLAAGGQTDLGNTPVRTYNATDPRSYYVNQNYTVGSGDRTSYFDVTLTEASSLATASNWVGSPNRGIVKFKLIPNSYNNGGTVGLLDVHGDSSWLQVFKPNSTGTNQEEVLVGGESFLLSNAVVITVNLLTNAVSVGPS